MEQTFALSGLHCRRCVERIEGEFRQAGFEHASVRLDTQTLTLHGARRATEDDVERILARAGNYQLKRQEQSAPPVETGEESVVPLVIVVVYILGGVLVRSVISGDYSPHTLMQNFMGVFFVVFSLFKLLNISGFADAYGTYDIVAMRSRAYALAYPFIELALGVLYLLGSFPLTVNLATVVIMSVGSIGVYRALRAKRRIQCACLGTALRLPMTKVTLVEDVAMALMALVMLVFFVL